MYQQAQQDDDELRSAIYGDQASVSPPSPTTSAGTAAPGASPQTPQAPQAAPSQPTSPTNTGGDIFSAIYNQQQPQAAQPAPQRNASGTAAPSPDVRTGTATAGGQAQTGDPVAHYRDAVSGISAATDPADRARQQDSLARTLYADLQTAGHDVKWDGDVMVIDGRRYTVGGGGTGTTLPGGTTIPNDFPDLGGIVDTQAPGAAQTSNPAWDTDGYATPQFTAQGTPEALNGWDQGHWQDPNHQNPKYVVGHILSQFSPTVDGLKQAWPQIAQAYPGSTFDGVDTVTIPGVGPVDLLEGAKQGGRAWRWGNEETQGGAPADLASAIYGIDAPGAAGVTTNSGAPAGGAGPAASAAPAGFTPTAPAYTPGAMGTDDIPDFTTAGLAAQMGGYTPGHYDVGTLDAGPVANDTESLVQRILQHPESLGPDDIERLKVQNREEAADAMRSDTDAMTAMGYETGNESAPWLSAQKLGLRSAANEQIQRGNRAVDMQAASTNAADRRSAAGVGSAYLAEQGTRQRGNEALRQSGAQMNESNAFNAATLQSNNVASSAKLSLDAAAQRGDRMALQESVKQAATQLGQSADKIRLDYITSTMDDLTKRYGIDVEAALKQQGITFDYAQLRQAGGEFQQELMFKLQQLAAQHETDMGGLALGWGNLEQRGNEADQAALLQGIYG